jgi:hypothetical protein
LELREGGRGGRGLPGSWGVVGTESGIEFQATKNWSLYNRGDSREEERSERLKLMVTKNLILISNLKKSLPKLVGPKFLDPVHGTPKEHIYIKLALPHSCSVVVQKGSLPRI